MSANSARFCSVRPCASRWGCVAGRQCTVATCTRIVPPEQTEVVPRTDLHLLSRAPTTIASPASPCAVHGVLVDWPRWTLGPSWRSQARRARRRPAFRSSRLVSSCSNGEASERFRSSVIPRRLGHASVLLLGTRSVHPRVRSFVASSREEAGRCAPRLAESTAGGAADSPFRSRACNVVARRRVHNPRSFTSGVPREKRCEATPAIRSQADQAGRSPTVPRSGIRKTGAFAAPYRVGGARRCANPFVVAGALSLV
jgi:hypothetical protein